MNSNNKTVLIELADKKLLRNIDKLSILENLTKTRKHASIGTNKVQKQIIDHKTLEAEIAKIKKEIEKLRFIIDNINVDGFGICGSCGTLISFQRLMLSPELKTCPMCK